MQLTPAGKLGIALTSGAFALALIGIAFVYSEVQRQKPSEETGTKAAVVRADSHRLSTAKEPKVTLVEFLDFECEACGAAFPIIEQLRTKYDGEVTFVARYFPLPGHRNAANAAHAVEAAARQDAFEGMYKRMFETQSKWGEQQESRAPLFRSYAADLGLDLDRYDADLRSASVARRVQKDVNDGLALEVSGTPTFFLNGEKLTISSTQDLIRAIDKALAG